MCIRDGDMAMRGLVVGILEKSHRQKHNGTRMTINRRFICILKFFKHTHTHL